MRVALFWDIDGTLLTTARAGVFALEAALAELTGRQVDLQQLVTAGLTDAEVAALALVEGGEPATPEVVDRFLRAYERHLPGCLHRRRGRVLPGVREALVALASRAEVRNLLLTGNTHAGARAKLAHYGLDGFFAPDEGAFCLGPGDRIAIARRAAPLAAAAAAVYVIGDTPADVRCGKAIGARTIAVATGSYSSDELAAHDPWLVVERVPEPRALERLLALAGSAGDGD